MSYLIDLKSSKPNLYRQMVHFDCIVTLEKSDREEGKNSVFNGKESHFTFFAILGILLNEVLNISLFHRMLLSFLKFIMKLDKS